MTGSISGQPGWCMTMALIGLASIVSLARADTVVADGMQPWEACAECHSLDGISVMARFPKLAGQRPGYIAKQVRDFREGRRRNDRGLLCSTTSAGSM